MNAEVRRLYRSRSERRWLGLCGGLAAYLGLDPVVVRLAVVLSTLLTGVVPGVLCYLFAWLIVPEEP